MEIQWFADDVDLSYNIIDALHNEVKSKINLFLTEELEHSLSGIRNNPIVIQCSTPKSKAFSSDVMKDFLEDNNRNHQIIFLIPIGYCTENSDHVLTDYISTIMMYDRVTVIAHSILCSSFNDVQGINPDESREMNCIQPITFNEISNILSNAFDKDFNHILVYAVGRKTFSPANDETSTFFSRLTTRNKKLLHTQYITPKRVDTGITDLLLQMSSEHEKKTILLPMVTE